jgi:hypothetical protein
LRHKQKKHYGELILNSNYAFDFFSDFLRKNVGKNSELHFENVGDLNEKVGYLYKRIFGVKFRILEVQARFFIFALENMERFVNRSQLHVAIRDNMFFKMVFFVAKSCEEIFSNDPELIVWYAELGDIDAVKEKLIANPQLANFTRNSDGYTPLMIAVAEGHIELSMYLMQKASDPDCVNHIGLSPLIISVCYGDIDMTRLLLSYNANPNLHGPLKMTALMHACERGHQSICTLLLEHGADPSLVDLQGNKAIYYAKTAGYGQIVNDLKKYSKQMHG